MTDVRFLAWRRAAGLTQAQAAARFGVKVLTINRWETGKIAVPAHVWERLELKGEQVPDSPPIDDLPVQITSAQVQRYWAHPDCPIVRQPYAEVPADAYDPKRWPMIGRDGKPTGQFWRVMTDGERAWKVAPPGVPTHIPSSLPEGMEPGGNGSWIPPTDDNGKPVRKVRGVYRGGPIPRHCKIVRVCRSQTDPVGRPWQKKAEASA